MSDVKRLTSRFGGSKRKKTRKKKKGSWTDTTAVGGRRAAPPPPPRRTTIAAAKWRRKENVNNNSSGHVEHKENTKKKTSTRRSTAPSSFSLSGMFSAIASALTPKGETTKRKKKKVVNRRLDRGAICTLCHEPIRKSRTGLQFCSSECKRYKEAIALRGIEAKCTTSSAATRSRSVVDRVSLMQVKKPTSKWGYFLMSRPPISRKKVTRLACRPTTATTKKRSEQPKTFTSRRRQKKSPPPPPPLMPSSSRTTTSTSTPKRKTSARKLITNTSAYTTTAVKKKTAMPREIGKIKKKPSGQIARTVASHQYLSKRGIDSSAIARKTTKTKRDEIQKKKCSATYVPKVRSRRTQPITVRSRVGRVPGKKQRLKAWCCDRAQACYGFKIRNFSGSWKSGRAFCAIVYSALPSVSALAPERTKLMKPRERLRLAFDTAHSMLGVEPLLEPEDITDLPRPDEKCVLLYVSMLHMAIASRGV